MRIQITKGGIYGQPTDENPTGELPIGTKLTVNKAPEGWAGRYIDLDAAADEPSEDVGALKARVAELEDQVKDRDEQIARLSGNGGQGGSGSGNTGSYTVTDKGSGWFAITQDGKEVTKSLRKDAVEGFADLDAEKQAAFVEANKAD